MPGMNTAAFGKCTGMAEVRDIWVFRLTRKLTEVGRNEMPALDPEEALQKIEAMVREREMIMNGLAKDIELDGQKIELISPEELLPGAPKK
ncbi:MAG TPA: hypothetical protein VMD02_03390 [Candidatus Omnitrophota bacterium]|nr:hypothetical protein [Candidatus Omnitrophota bacterium]